jgi:hypothetical protein
VQELIRKLKAKKMKMEKFETQMKPILVRYERAKKEYDKLKDELILEMDKQKMKSAEVGGMKFRISETTVPTLKDFDAFMNYVTKTKNFDLVTKRINSTSFREHFLKDGKYDLPKWAGTFTRKFLSVK